MPNEIEKRFLSIVDGKKYKAWKRRFRVNVGMYPVGGFYVEKGDSDAAFDGSEEELMNLLESSVESGKDLVSPHLKVERRASILSPIPLI